MPAQNHLMLIIAGLIFNKIVSGTIPRPHCYGKRVQDFDNKLSTELLLNTTTARSKLECSSQCLRLRSCDSYFFVNKTGVCQLHTCVLDVAKSTYNHEDGARYFSLCTSTVCPTAIGYEYEPSIRSFYKIDSVTAGGATAGKNNCEDDGGHLLTVRDISTQNWIVGKIQANAAYDTVGIFFIDGSDAATAGTWLNNRNKQMTWMYWDAPAQPNNSPTYGNQHCLALYRATSFKWNDLWCDDQFETVLAYICQIEITD